MRKIKELICFMLVWLFSGCVTVIKPPMDPTVVTPESALKSWARVLGSAVDERGRIDFQKIARNPQNLYAYLSYVAQISPYTQRFPSRQHELAYRINSYNALAMYGVIQKGFPKDFFRFVDRAEFFKLTEYVIGKQKISLYDYENDVIRPLGEPRVHFALNCMVKDCPRLPREPFIADKLDEQLDLAAREFLNDSRKVKVIPEKGVARLSEILKFYEKDFVNPDQADSLIDYVNRYRPEPIPENFQMEFIPYDWTVNRK